MIPPLRCFELYSALNLHFKEGSKYDFFKYKGKTNCSEASFLKRNDKYTFQALAKKSANEDIAIDYMVANFIFGETYIRGFTTENYTKFQAYKEAYEYRFLDDHSSLKISTVMEELLMDDYTNLIFICIYDYLLDGFIFKQYSERYQDDILWKTLFAKLGKIRPFIINRFGFTDINRKSLIVKVKAQNKK